MLDRIKATLSISYKDDKVRQLLLFQILNLLLFAVAATMSVVNIATGESVLFWETTIYAILCLINFVFSRKSQLAKHFFFIETVILLSVFIITGVPGGFSILWILVVPAAAMSIFGMRVGSFYSAIIFMDVIFFFWIPFGQSLLMYDYSDTYMLRFPFVYVCMYGISFYVEWIRKKTNEDLIEAERKNNWLSHHDALTGAYNRYAFSEKLNPLLANASNKVVGTILMDIDNFKQINDTYGHNVGDRVLCRLSDIILNTICKHCLSCRWGGEEFLIVMGCEHNPMEIAETIRHEVEQDQIKLETGEVITFTISAGVSLSASVTPETFSERVNCADKAMYAAKKAGKNKVVLGE